MNNAIEIDGKKLHPIKSVAEQVSYSRDYITRLAREGKIIATNVGRQWFVDLDSLKKYVENTNLELDIRKKQLSEERKKEQQVNQVSSKLKNHQLRKAKALNFRATVAASAVLTFGLIGGWTAYNFMGSNFTSQSLVANTFEAPETQVEKNLPVLVNKNSNLAVASATTTKPKVEQKSTSTIRPIADDVASGILLLPQGSLTASPTEMFSDEVEVLTSPDGTQVVVMLDKNGKPTGEVIPFVTVPVNHSGP